MQKSSLGRRLIDQVMGRFQSTGVKLVRTLVSDQHAEMGTFLEKMGFQSEPIRVLSRITG